MRASAGVMSIEITGITAAWAIPAVEYVLMAAEKTEKLLAGLP